MTDQDAATGIQPLVNWPRIVEAGHSYRITVDLRLADAAPWPYDEEELIIGCTIDGRPTCRVLALGDAGVVLHRFGGSYGPAQFLAEVFEDQTDFTDAALWLTLTTAGGVPFYTGKLPLDGSAAYPDDDRTAPMATELHDDGRATYVATELDPGYGFTPRAPMAEGTDQPRQPVSTERLRRSGTPLTPGDIRNKQFSTTRLRPGYDEEEVDNFLDKAEAELSRLIDEGETLSQSLTRLLQSAPGTAALGPNADTVMPPERYPSLTPEDIRNKQFSTTRMRLGYDEEEVDTFLDELETAFGQLIRENEELRIELAEAAPVATELAERTDQPRQPVSTERLRRSGTPLTPGDIRNKQFSTTRLRPGYDEEEVDNFLDKAEAELSRLIDEGETLSQSLTRLLQSAPGTAALGPNADTVMPPERYPSLTPGDIRNKQFSTTRMRLGYDEEEVDTFLDELETAFGQLIRENEGLRIELAQLLPQRRSEQPPPSTDSPLLEAETFTVRPYMAASAISLAANPGDAGKTLAVDMVSSATAVEASTTVPFDVDDLLARSDQLRRTVLAQVEASPRIVAEAELPVREIGAKLFNALLGTGELAGRYRAATAVAVGRRQQLRILLRIDSPTLAALPWETMYDEATNAYVCRQCQLIRCVDADSAPLPQRVRPPLRVLGIVSSPLEMPALSLEKEKDNLAQALDGPVGRGLVELHWAPEASWAELQAILLDGPWHIVHFIGHAGLDVHGDEGSVTLVTDDGRADSVAAHQFVDLLHQASPIPRLVVLNSCRGSQNSASNSFSRIADALVRGGISSVVVMQYEVSERSASAFARAFYSDIADGRSIDESLTSGRVAIRDTSQHTLEWLTPVLYLRGRDPRLFGIV